MSSITLTAELLKGSRRSANKFRNGYEIDFWREVTKRWLVLGVLCAVLLAVMTPKIGASGGFLHTEYTVYLPISYIYYTTGRSCLSFSHVSRRACLIGITHTHIVGPALAVSLSQAIVEKDSINRGLLTGVILSSIGGPCGWLSLSVCTGASERARAAAILVCNYATSLLAEPLYIFILCGRFTHPPLFPTLFSIATTVMAFALGTYHHASSINHMALSANHIISSANQAVSSTRNLITSANQSISSPKRVISSTNKTHDLINMITLSTGHKVSNNDPNHMIPSPNTVSSANQNSSSINYTKSSFSHMATPANHTMSSAHQISSANLRLSSAHNSMSSSMKAQCCALVALYVECCTRLREAEGELYVTHVFATLILVLGWLCLNALFCCVYYRSGFLSYEDTYTVALCSVPKCLDVGWEFGTLCVPTGLSLLPAAFLAPSQALLLAAASRPDDDDDKW